MPTRDSLLRCVRTTLLFGIGICLTGSSEVCADDETIDFDRQIRPLLSDNCFHCHGPDEATREAGLRLDTQEDAVGDHGAFVAGDIESSEAMARILSDDPDDRMPPPESKLTLSDNERELLRRWIEQGAKWSEHWAYVVPEMPTIPEDESGWARTDIDRLIVAAAKKQNLKPLTDADKATLIRRVTLDLTGLPPTPEEVDAFLSDSSFTAYENLVDRLLASDRYGERMAWEWMDAARYADTDGFQGDPTRTMWPWRDWLVRSLNANMPFDQFTIEMLAGDLLPSATEDQVLATGFNRNHMFNGEGGRISEETRVENVFDRTETTATVWMGLTFTCCRCHDHKYDALSQSEYFQLYDFFNNTSETGRSGRGKTAPVLQYLASPDRERRAELRQSLAEVQQKLDNPSPEIDAAQAEWEKDLIAKLKTTNLRSKFGPFHQLGPISMDPGKAFSETLAPEKKVDLRGKFKGHSWKAPENFTQGIVFPLDETVGPTFFFKKVNAPSARKMQLSLGSDDNIKVWVNGKEVLAKKAARAAAPDQEVIDVDIQEGENELLIKIVNTGGIGGFFFRVNGESLFGLPPNVMRTLAAPAEHRLDKHRTLLKDHFRMQVWPEFKALSKQREAFQKELEQLDKRATTVMVMDDLPPNKRRKTAILDRGGYDKPTDVFVSSGTPSVLPALPDGESPNRLTLARWLVDPKHPLTARVTVNRYWQTFFGRGIVPTTEDFGIQGERPTHPELLDYLATKFVSSGWDVKAIHKEIVMSSVYRQASTITGDALERDPENIWLTRAPRFRMPSWMLRDVALASSGLLNGELGGPPVKPYQPQGIWADATFGKIKYSRDTGNKLYRRSLYVFWRRIVGPTMFFDGAKRQTCEVKPSRTNTPLHALTTLNETTFVESARAMAQRILLAEKDAEKQISLAFRLTTARPPSEAEHALIEKRLQSLEADFGQHPEDAKSLLSVGESTRDESLDLARHAALTLVCSTLMNLDESLTRH